MTSHNLCIIYCIMIFVETSNFRYFSHKAHNRYLSKRISKLSTKKSISVSNFVPPNFNLNKNVLMDLIYISLCQTSKQNLKEPLILCGKTSKR